MLQDRHFKTRGGQPDGALKREPPGSRPGVLELNRYLEC